MEIFNSTEFSVSLYYLCILQDNRAFFGTLFHAKQCTNRMIRQLSYKELTTQVPDKKHTENQAVAGLTVMPIISQIPNHHFHLFWHFQKTFSSLLSKCAILTTHAPMKSSVREGQSTVTKQHFK